MTEKVNKDCLKIFERIEQQLNKVATKGDVKTLSNKTDALQAKIDNIEPMVEYMFKNWAGDHDLVAFKKKTSGGGNGGRTHSTPTALAAKPRR